MKKIIYVFLTLLLFHHTPIIYSQTWSSLGKGLDYPVNTIVDFNGNIYAGSDLVYQWTNNSWTSITNGLFGVSEIDAMAVNNGTLYISGTFFVTTPDLNLYNYAARLNNGSWTTCGSGKGNDGSGMDGVPYAAISFGGSLYAGGNFNSAGGSPLNPQIAMYIARFDGSLWSPVGSGMDEHVTDMTIYNNELIVSGYFTHAGGVQTNYIASWNGNTWHSLGSGMSSSNTCKVTALTAYNGSLYAGGLFEIAGGNTAHNIAKWDGSSWSSVGNGINGQVYTLTSYNGQLYAGGNFIKDSGNPGNYIIKWDGSNWSDVGGGTDDAVNFFLVSNNKLYVGGYFTSAGNQTSKHIAIWTDGSPNAITADRRPDVSKFSLYQNYPNPFNPVTTIDYSVPKTGFVTIKVYDILGREVMTLLNENKLVGNYNVEFNASKLVSGVYFYRLQAGGFVQTKKLILLK